MKHLCRTLIITLAALLAMPVLAEDFWAHRIAKQTDVAYGEDPLQKMDVYIHGQRVGEPTYFKTDGKPRPTLVWIHGGGWVAGDKVGEITQLIPYLERGWNVFNLNYRQGPGTAPQAVEDVMCAYQEITRRLSENGQPTDQIVVSGASAGGHLALAVGLLNTTGDHPCRTRTPPKAVVNWFGITDIELVDEYLDGAMPDRNYARSWIGSAAAVADVSARFSPVMLINDDAPPIITIHGTADTVVPFDQAESFHSALTTPNELVSLKDGNHSGFTDDQYQQALRAIFSFIDAH